MSLWTRRLSVLLLAMCGLLCGGSPGVLVDIGSWPDGAVSLRVESTLNGVPASAPLSFPGQTTRFVVYLQGGQNGVLDLRLTALDRAQCVRALGTAQLELGSRLRPIAEAAVPLTALPAPQCPAPQILGITPALASTAGGSLITITGQSFVPGATLTVDGVETQVISLSVMQLTAFVPKRPGALGKVQVLLTNPDGQSASRADLFGYYADQITFSAATPFAAGTNPRGVAVADFNEDGAADLAIANGANDVSLLLGNGSGGFGPGTLLPVGPNTTAIATGDLNGDQKADLVVVTFGRNCVTTLLGDGKGGFGQPTLLPAISSPAGLALADVNRDGALDIVSSGFYDDKVYVLLGNGKGGFGGPSGFATGTSPAAAAIADLNADQKPDLAVVNSRGASVSVLLGDGQGGFAGEVRFATGRDPSAVAAADWNRDGKTDLAVTNFATDDVSILLGNGQGGFGAATQLAAGAGPVLVAETDLDGDQRFDLAIADRSSSRVSLLYGNGKGGFTPLAPLSLAAGATPYFVIAADLNRDQRPDLVTANFGDGSISVFLNQSK